MDSSGIDSADSELINLNGILAINVLRYCCCCFANGNFCLTFSG